MFKALKTICTLVLILAVKITWAADPQTTGLHLSFEQRLAVTYAILAQGETDEQKELILKRAKNYFLGVASKGVQVVKVQNFKQFLNQYKGEWPDTNSVALDLEKIESKGPQPVKLFKSDSPRIQRQIERYIDWCEEELLKMAHAESKSKIPNVENLPKAVAGLVLTSMGSKIAEKIILQQIEIAISEKMKQLDIVGEKMAESGFGADLDPATKISMQTILGEYFSRLGPKSKKLIASSFLGGNLYADDMAKFEIMVQNAGPQFQKFLQIVARQSEDEISAEISAIFKRLEDSVRKVPWSQVKEIYDEEKENYDFVYFEQDPLGVGSIAQVHRSKIVENNQRYDTVSRLKKPYIEERVDEDERILYEIAQLLDNNPEFRKTGAPKITPIISDISATAVAELEQDETGRMQELAVKPYSKEVLISLPGYKTYLQFHVPKIFKPKGKSNFLVQELVIGRKLDKEVEVYGEAMPGLKLAIIEEMAKLWAYEVLFGSGFYHSDLHQGNFLINVTEPKITVHILDYGMGGVISGPLQRRMMVLGAGIELVDPSLITRGFWSISDKQGNTISEESLKTLVHERVNAVQGTPDAVSLEKWTAWAMDNGLKLPYEFISLNRGIVIINKLLKNAGSTLSIPKIMKNLGMQNPLQIYKKLALQEGIPHEDLIKLGWKEVKKRLSISQKPAASQNSCGAVFK